MNWRLCVESTGPTIPFDECIFCVRNTSVYVYCIRYQPAGLLLALFKHCLRGFSTQQLRLPICKSFCFSFFPRPIDAMIGWAQGFGPTWISSFAFSHCGFTRLQAFLFHCSILHTRTYIYRYVCVCGVV